VTDGEKQQLKDLRRKQIMERFPDDKSMKQYFSDLGKRGSKVTASEVEEIRRSSETNETLATQYNLHPTSISRIKNHRSR